MRPLIIILLLTSCTKEYYQEPALLPYYYSFEQYSRLYGGNMRHYDFELVFSGDCKSDGADCWARVTHKKKYKRIIFKRSVYDSLYKHNFGAIEYVMFHEFGHAFLDLDHIDGTIMEANLVYKYNNQNREQYIKQLFEL